MEIIVDASAIMAVIVKEPERELVIQLTREAVMVSPNMVSFEIANAYDACYLEASKRLNLPLLTFDNNMIKAGSELGINILGGKNARV